MKKFLEANLWLAITLFLCWAVWTAGQKENLPLFYFLRTMAAICGAVSLIKLTTCVDDCFGNRILQKNVK